jgi:glycosyltransferase involved in cell wall biosynthesis
MRITFVLNDAGLAGGVRVVAVHAARLKARGHEVRIVSRPYRFPRRSDRARAALKSMLRRLTGAPEPSHLSGIAVEHRRLAPGCMPGDAEIPDGDVVVATWWETAEWVSRLSASKGAKAYFVQHHEIHEGQPVERVEATWRLPLRKIAVSQWLVDVARQRYGDGRAILVPNSVDLGLFHAPPRAKQRTPTVGMMYHAAPYKGCDVCLRAFEWARRDIAGLRLVAFGTSRPLRRLPLPAGTVYARCPLQERLRRIYASCDAWLFGSRVEGFGLPLLEAMACRTPVIATPAGAAPELLAQDGGILVPPEDPEAMTEAIVQICRMSEPAWRDTSSAALATARRYTWDDAADRMEAALREIVDEERERGTEGRRDRGRVRIPSVP